MVVDINRMLGQRKSFDRIIAFAAEHGLSLSKAGLSRNNADHDTGRAAFPEHALTVELCTQTFLAKVTTLTERQSLESLNPQELTFHRAIMTF